VLASRRKPFYPAISTLMTQGSIAPSPYPAIGEVINARYRIDKLLGEGGMGAVARATHTVLNLQVALKFMNPQFMTFPGAVDRFANEGRASANIKSDHVVPVTDVGFLPNGTPYLVMECLEGQDLADLLAREGPSGLPIQRAVHFLIQILRALQAAHAIGIIHRDMKPSNCFVVHNDGEDDFVKILDFGISKIAQPGSASLTQTNSALGTPLYMSPEQARSPRDVDLRSDIYSVGVILYELLTGHTPFFSESGEFTEILFKLFTADPPHVKATRPDLPDALADVVHKALAREAANRYATALEMAEALEPFAGPRTLSYLEKMRGFKAPTKVSIAPAEGVAASMAAFSHLQKLGTGTDVMANRPTTEVQKGPPVTEVMPNVPKTAVMPGGLRQYDSGGRLAATPVDAAARAEPHEAVARTQYDTGPKPKRSVPPGGSTDLGASRDATTANDEKPTRPAFVYVLPVAAVALLVGAVLLVLNLTKKPESTQAAPPPSAITLPPAASSSPTPTTPVSVDSTPTPVVSAPPSASSSAPVKPKPPPPNPNTRPNPNDDPFGPTIHK
jgi:eukaryotic-like serine/threonine-protein kinase